MPIRRLPRADAERDAALRNAKIRKDTIPAMPVIPYTAGTITRIDTFQPAYRLKFQAVTTAKNTQTGLTASIIQAQKQVVFYEQDFIEALNKAIRRGEFLASVRSLYHLDVNDPSLPRITTESDITTWGQNINDGETARIAAGGAPITFPSLAQVNAAVSAFNSLNQQQENAKALYDIAQEQLEAQNPEADKLILKMWNETETAFDEGDKASMRRKCRQWGVVYIPSPGEVISPDEFSITGTITDSVTGLPVSNAAVVVQSPETIVTTDAQGKYFVPLQPAGSYIIFVHKDGYIEHTVGGVVVTDGAITIRDIEITPGAAGTVAGNVTKAGVPAAASITIAGMAGGVTTDPMGNYINDNVPEGPQVVKCALDSDPTNFQTQNIIVSAGGIITVNFVFP